MSEPTTAQVDADDCPPVEDIAYALADCSMDIADRGGIPSDLWEEVMGTASDLLTYCVPAMARALARTNPDAMLAALTERGALTEDARTRLDGYGGMVDTGTGAGPMVIARAATKERRLVTPWEVVP